MKPNLRNDAFLTLQSLRTEIHGGVPDPTNKRVLVNHLDNLERMFHLDNDTPLLTVPSIVSRLDQPAHVMFDLETAATHPEGAILSIGAVVMNTKFETLREREWVLDWQEEPHLFKKFVVDPGTFMWWLQQKEAARMKLVKSEELSLPSTTATEFWDWCVPTRGDWEGVQVWGNGASFDLPMLESFIRVTAECHGRKPVVPWKHWNIRCYRTIKALYSFVKVPENNGVSHGALDDARFQAQHLKRMLASSGL